MKTRILIIILIILTTIPVNSQQDKKEDKFSSVNLIIKKVTSTELGFIAEYYAGGKFRELYLPAKFFLSGIAIKINEDDPNIAPQMNIIYKNLVPIRVKIYVPTIMIGIKYPALEVLPKEMIDKFNSTNKIDIVLKD